ncbi:putative orfan [Tupanvirus soda lake]|uniref:Orfan n=2 Tax=Tupanvirus TaxID=2094720 RepID=A0AC62ACX8_9VIRU|nr:putative orfan [Tupanvirus soda lake]QKU35645.1 putative orfan [Tupanvirus soda lake]
MFNWLFPVETVHFILGFLGCWLWPDVVVKTYTLYPDVDTDEQTYEFINVITSFYFSFVLMLVLATKYDRLKGYVSFVLLAFYSSLVMRDITDIITVGYESNWYNRVMDTSVHVIGAILHFYNLFPFTLQ